MSDFDDLVEKAARALWRQDHAGTTTPWRKEPLYLESARAALLAVGLPALLERVEVAEERERDLLRSIQQAYIERKEHVALAAKVADAGERIALAIEKANRKVIDARVADDYTRPQIVDRVLTYAAQIARTALDASETP